MDVENPMVRPERVYEDDIKRLDVSFECDDCASPVYEGHEYIQYGKYRLCSDSCLVTFMEINSDFEYKNAPKPDK